jgi:hypothetical protein
MRTRFDTDATGKNCPRANVRVCAHHAIVINDGTGVDDGVGPNSASRLEHRARHDLDSIFHLRFRSDDGRWMYHGRKAISLTGEAIVDLLAPCRGTDRTHAIHKPHITRCMKQYLSVAPAAFASEQWRRCRVQVNESEDPPPAE